MKNYLLIIVVVFLSSCESKEEINKQIAEMKVEILDLENSKAEKDYNRAVLILSTTESGLDMLKEQQKLFLDEGNVIEMATTIEGVELRIEVEKKRVDLLKSKYDDVCNLIKIKEKEILGLEKRLE